MSGGGLTETLRETLAQFDPSGEPRTTPEVAEDLDLGRRSTYNRLQRLAEHDRLRTKKVGANARVWWRPPATARDVPDWSAAAESLVDDVLDDVEVGVFVLDENFDVAWVNQATERYFGLDREHVVGRDKRRLVQDHLRSVVDDSSGFAETVLATYDDNTYTEQFECHVTAGEERWLEHRSRPIDAGAYAGGRVELYYDVTERKQTQLAHREDREQFESVVSAVEEYAIFTLDPDGYVQTWNPGVERISGYEADDLLGEHVSVFYTEEERAAGVPEQNLATAAERGSVEEEAWRVRRDGSRFWASATLTAIRDDDGTLQGYATVTRDMTEQREREHQLRRERDLTERLLETAPVRLAVVESDGSIERMNAQARAGFDVREASLSEFDVTDLDIYDADGDPVSTDEHPVNQVFETGERVSDLLVQYDSPAGHRWISLTAAPLSGDDSRIERVVVAGRDVTDLKQKERQLERSRDELRAELDDVLTRIDDAFYALDDEMQFAYVNERAEELLGFPESELLGRTVWETLSVAEDDPIRERFRTAMATQEPATFERYSEPLGIWEIVRIYPSESGLSVYFTDITERKERERELEEYRRWNQTLIENFPSGAVALVDEELRYVTFGGTLEGDTDVTRGDLEGQRVREALPEQVAAVVVPGYEAALGGEPSEFVETIDGRVHEFHFVPVRDEDGDVFAATAMSRDVTEQREREELLREAKTQLEAATDAGAVGTWEWQIPDDEFVAGSSFARTFGIDPDAAREGVALDRPLSAVHEDDRERVERAIENALASCGEYREEYRVWNASDDLRWVVARGHVECDEEGNPTTFPGALVDITERKQAEQELERQRGQLAALNSLNEVVREITDAVIDQSTREEIEAAVCERLTESNSYEFAWIAETDPQTQSITPRVEAGVDGYLDDISLSFDPDDPVGKGPTGRAVRTREIQTTRDALKDPEFQAWREHAKKYGYRSTAAIPIVYEDTLYGVLGVYAERPEAFEGQEREVIAQLGEVVGHAIAATERKQALLSDELVELDFRVPDVFAATEAPVETNEPITLDHAVPVADGAFLVYGTATTDALDTVRGLVDVLPHWESVSVISEDDSVTFELRVSDPPVLSVVASRGGYIDDAVIEDGDFRMTIHVAPSVDVRQITGAVEAAYPQAELLRRQQVSQSRDESRLLHHRLAVDLTDRQRAALEAAYHAGFFEWPRETTGESVAESLDIAPSTFHHHLRKAQQKALGAMLSA